MDVFISYSHKDHLWKERVALYMQCMRRNEHFDYGLWDDGEIKVSQEWRRLIEHAIDNAKIAVLLVSPDFLASPFINEVEIPRILERRARGELAVAPLIVRPCPWEVVDWLSAIQLHPTGGKALSGGTEFEIETELTQLTLEIHRLLSAAGRASEESDAPEDGAAAPAPESGYRFIGVEGVKEVVKNDTGEIVLETMPLYQVSTQQVWLAFSNRSVMLVIDSAKTAARQRFIQWRQQNQPGLAIAVRDHSRMRYAGVVDIGLRQNWLYSKRLHPDPNQLQAEIQERLERTRRL